MKNRFYVVKVTKVSMVLVEMDGRKKKGEEGEAQRLAMLEVDGDEAETEDGPFSAGDVGHESWMRHADKKVLA
jgi:hypothetical protein